MNIQKVVFNLSKQGLTRLAPITASVGTIATQAAGDKTVTWTGDANSIKYTVGAKADFGSDDPTKSGQFDFTSIVITYTQTGVAKKNADMAFDPKSVTLALGEGSPSPRSPRPPRRLWLTLLPTRQWPPLTPPRAPLRFLPWARP